MNGPCLCGDPVCPSCGQPGAAELEAAFEWACEQFDIAKLSADEVRTCVLLGLSSITLIREAVKQAIKDEHDCMEFGL